jgi:hypothetical protein
MRLAWAKIEFFNYVLLNADKNGNIGDVGKNFNYRIILGDVSWISIGFSRI